VSIYIFPAGSPLTIQLVLAALPEKQRAGRYLQTRSAGRFGDVESEEELGEVGGGEVDAADQQTEDR